MSRSGDRAVKDAGILEETLGELPAPVERPVLIMLSGLPGTGKSHLTRELRRRVPLAVVQSDLLRKTLFARPRYTPAESGRLFAACHLLTSRLLERGIPVVFDATNLKESYRKPLYAIAGRCGAKLVLVQVTAPLETVRRRLDARAAGPGEDVSEAGFEVYEKMAREVEPFAREHLTVDTSDDIGAAVDAVIRALDYVG